ncbi:MAG TPA: chemotaxis protein CheW [Candidatus Polarisedimenticolia bacterium]|jgi:purine-binding chemotaxis protein CheW
MKQYLMIGAGAYVCAIPIEEIVETMRPLAAERVPGMPPYVRGLSVIRGSPVAVVDLVSLMGGAGSGDVTRFVTIRAGSRVVALAVPEVLGVGPLDDPAAGTPLPLIENAHPGLIQSTGTMAGRLLMVLRAGRILPEMVWGEMLSAGRGA